MLVGTMLTVNLWSTWTTRYTRVKILHSVQGLLLDVGSLPIQGQMMMIESYGLVGIPSVLGPDHSQLQTIIARGSMADKDPS